MRTKRWHASMLGRTVIVYSLGPTTEGRTIYKALLYKGAAWKGAPYVEVVFTPEGKAPRFIFAELIRTVQKRAEAKGDPVKKIFPRPSYLSNLLGWSVYSDKGERGSKGYREAYIERIAVKYL